VGARESKRALAEAAVLLGTDAQSARVYLRDVQRLAGQLPFAVIVAAMRAAETTDMQAVAVAVATVTAETIPHDEHASEG
jgi:hypothetical protein